MLTDTNKYERAVEDQMILQARRCAQLEMALEAVRAKLLVFSMMTETPGTIAVLRDLVTRIDIALETKS